MYGRAAPASGREREDLLDYGDQLSGRTGKAAEGGPGLEDGGPAFFARQGNQGQGPGAAGSPPVAQRRQVVLRYHQLQYHPVRPWPVADGFPGA